MNKKDTYILDNDQPTWCPICGARTEFKEFYDEDENIMQSHICLNRLCGYEFTGIFENLA